MVSKKEGDRITISIDEIAKICEAVVQNSEKRMLEKILRDFELKITDRIVGMVLGELAVYLGKSYGDWNAN